MQISDGTIFLCFSPVLDYGISSLLQKCTKNSLMIICEFDNELKKIQNEWKNNFKDEEKIIFLNEKELYDLPAILSKSEYEFESKKKYEAWKFKRIKRIDFCAGINFYEQKYQKLEDLCINAQKTYWTNRMTLVKFGRKYSSNLFKNLKNISETVLIKSFFKSIEKPIIVFGAGESLDEGVLQIRKNQKDFFILCVDTALQPLLKSGIEVDGVFIEEAQNVILKAFIGTQAKKHKFHIFAGISSVSNLLHFFEKDRISFFASEYSDSSFFKNLSKKDFFPPVNPGFGSVGLTSVFYALKFRKNQNVKIFVFGLDFSQTAGRTHAKGTLANIEKLSKSTRIKNSQNYESSFCSKNKKFISKDKKIYYTTPILFKYSQLFIEYFENEKNLFNASSKGIEIGLPRIKIKDFLEEIQNENSKNEVQKSIKKIKFNEKTKNEVNEFLNDEKNFLERLVNLLSRKISADEKTRSEEIQKIAKNRQYLYLHFPDGTHFYDEIQFLKRIRSECDYFLKWLE